MEKLNITIPQFCTSEVKYVMHCMFDVFLGVDYTISVSEIDDHYTISYGEGNIIIDNCFFKSDDLASLYALDTMPSKAIKAQCSIGKKNLPLVSLYGSPIVREKEGSIHFKSDLVASTFFMLTRWEESIMSDRDSHDRFPGSSSFAYRHGFLDRPVVNEYVELLWHSLLHLGYTDERKVRQYTIVPTHDIDDPLMWMNTSAKLKSLMFSVLKSPNIMELWRKVVAMSQSRDPYDNYDLMMKAADNAGAKAIFYFLANGDSKYDRSHNLQDARMQKIIQSISAGNHTVGIHPSYESHLNSELIEDQKNTLKDLSVRHSRQHYLRVSVPVTWQMWELAGISYDSTMGYADIAGYRCGVCYDFPLYDFIARRQLDVIEQPLIVMDVSLQQYEKLSPSESLERVSYFQNETKKYNGNFVFLWHNSSFFTAPWREYEGVFQSLYKA